MTGIRVVLGVSAGALFFAGVFNVAELPFAEDVLGSTRRRLLGARDRLGLGFIAGSLSGSAAAAGRSSSRAISSAWSCWGGLLSSGVAPNWRRPLVAFAIAGLGNGMLLVFERQIIQAFVPDRLAGRVFGIKDALSAWAFGSAFICAGALISLIGTRELHRRRVSGRSCAWLASVQALRGALEDGGGGRRWRARQARAPRRSATELWTSSARTSSGGGSGGLRGGDRHAERLDDVWVELSAGSACSSLTQRSAW